MESVEAKHRWVKEGDGRRRRHSIVIFDGEEVDLTVVRRQVSRRGFKRRGPPMQGIRPNMTKVKGGLTLGQTGGGLSVREAKAEGAMWVEHDGNDPMIG